MEVFPGQRKGTKWYVYEGFTYHRDSRFKSGTAYICALRTLEKKCRVTARKNKNNEIEVKGVHNHDPPCIKKKHAVRKIISELKRKALESDASVDEIYRDEELRHEDFVHFMLPASAKMTIIRARESSRPKLPKDFRDLEATIRQYGPSESIFQGNVRASDGSTAVIFASTRMVDRLNTTPVLFVDGTFKSVPKKPKASQLLIFHMQCLYKGIAAVYVLCEKKTTAMYEAIWSFLVERAPGMKINLKNVMMDYEMALIESTRRSLPGVIVRGCRYHFLQALSRKWQNLGLDEAPKDVLWLANGIPLLPSNQFQDAMKILKMKCKEKRTQYPDGIRIFVDYMEQHWLRYAESSVYGFKSRTNNICESFNKQIVRKLGGAHPNLFRFIERLSKIIANTECDWKRLELGQKIGQHGRKVQQQIDLYIELQQKKLADQRITVRKFLRSVQTPKKQSRILPRSTEMIKTQLTAETLVENVQNKHKLTEKLPKTSKLCSKVTSSRYQRKKKNEMIGKKLARPRRRSALDNNIIRYKIARPKKSLPKKEEIRYKIARPKKRLRAEEEIRYKIARPKKRLLAEEEIRYKIARPKKRLLEEEEIRYKIARPKKRLLAEEEIRYKIARPKKRLLEEEEIRYKIARPKKRLLAEEEIRYKIARPKKRLLAEEQIRYKIARPAKVFE